MTDMRASRLLSYLDDSIKAAASTSQSKTPGMTTASQQGPKRPESGARLWHSQARPASQQRPSGTVPSHPQGRPAHPWSPQTVPHQQGWHQHGPTPASKAPAGGVAGRQLPGHPGPAPTNNACRPGGAHTRALHPASSLSAAGSGHGALRSSQDVPQHAVKHTTQQRPPGSLLLTEAALKQLPIGDRPSGYRAVPSEVGTNAGWWRGPATKASVVSYPRTAVTERGSVTPSEMAAWEAKMSEMERTLKDEKIRRQRFEEQLKELQDIAISRGKLSTGIATAGGSTTTAGQQQQQQMLQQRLAGVRAS